MACEKHRFLHSSLRNQILKWFMAQKSYQRSRTKEIDESPTQTREELAESVRPTEISNLFKRNK